MRADPARWVGEPPEQQTAEQLERYRSYVPPGAAAKWGADEMAAATDTSEVADRLSTRRQPPAPTR